MSIPFRTGCPSNRRQRSRSCLRRPIGCWSREQRSARANGFSYGGSAAVCRSRAGLAIAKALGARAIVTSSSDVKLERATELGDDVVVNHATGDVKAAVLEATGGRGADVVVEHVGKATWRTSLDVAAREGRIAVCGATTGPNPHAALHRIWWKQVDPRLDDGHESRLRSGLPPDRGTSSAACGRSSASAHRDRSGT